MKRLATFVLLAIFSLALLVPAQAQRLNNEQSARANIKAGKQQQKMLKRSAKRQRKAMKRSLKEQRKENRKSNRELQKRKRGH